MWFWRKQPLLKGYISELDRFLQDFDRKPEASSASRRAEEIAYERINELRDRAQAANDGSSQIWKDS